MLCRVKYESGKIPCFRVKHTHTFFSMENLNPFSLGHLCKLFIATWSLHSQIDKLQEETDTCKLSTYEEYWIPEGRDSEIELNLNKEQCET